MHLFHKRREKQPKRSTYPYTTTLSLPVGGRVAQSSSESPARATSPNPTPDSVQTAPAIKQSRDLWKEAFDSLDKDQRDSLQERATSGASDAIRIVDSVIDLTKKGYEAYRTQGWHIKKNDHTKEANVRIRAKEMICSALQFKDTIDQGLKFDPSGYGTIVWGVVSGGLQLLQNDTDRIQAVFDSAAEMAKILAKYAIIETQYRDWALQEEAAFEDRLVAVYNALLLYAVEAKNELHKSVAGKLFASFWSIENQNITSVHACLTKKDEEATDMLHLVAHQQRKMEFLKLDEKATQSLDLIDGMVETLLESKKVRILSWLSDAKSVNPSDKQHSLRVQIERDNRESGQWFLTSPEFSDWQRGPGSFLWLHGASGCGKSGLCSTIINCLAQPATTSQAKILVYWYFDNGNPKTQDLRALLRFFLRQIAADADVLPPPVRDLAAKHESLGSDPEVEELCKTLHETISGVKEEVLIVIDAVDEYPADGTVDRRYDLLSVIFGLIDAQLEKLHVVVTSVDERDIRDIFHSLDKPPVELAVELLLSEDVDSLVDATIERFASSKPWWTHEIKMKVINTLKDRDYKRFRIVALQLDDLNKCFDELEIDQVLNRTPPTVEDLYECRLGEVAKKDIFRLRHIFCWISLAGRQLSLRELAAAPGVNLRDPKDIFAICPGGMVKATTNNDGASDMGKKTSSTADLGKAADEIVVFDHPSVKRFLFSQKLRRSEGIASEFSLVKREVHVELARLILEYLLTIKQSQISAVFLESEPFLSYAAGYCIVHLQAAAAISTDESQTTPLLLDLFGSPMRPAFLNWMRVADPLNSGHHLDLREINCPSPLYVAIELRLQRVVDHLITNCSFINSQGGEHFTALHLALVQNDYSLALRLVEEGANPNQSDGNGSSPLYLAVRAGAKELVQKLLVSGAKIDNKEGEYGNALQLACYLGDLKIVQALFAFNPDVNGEGGLFGTALQAASAIGHEDVVAILLERKAHSDTPCGLLGNAIQAAITGGHTGVVEQLVANGATFDPKGDKIWTEAFEKRAMRKWRDDWTRFLAPSSESSSWQGLSKSQQLLATALVVLQRSHSAIEKTLGRLPRRRSYRKVSDDDDMSDQEIIAFSRRLHEIGLECRSRGGFQSKALFLAAICRSLLELLEIGRRGRSKLSTLLTVVEILESRKVEQSVVENDNSGVYDIARHGLIELYDQAFMIASMFMEFLGKGKQLRQLLWTSFGPNIDRLLQLLLNQNQMFMSAMFTANTSAVLVQTANPEPRIIGELRGEIQHEIDERFMAALCSIERRVVDAVREILPGIIREEVRKAIQESQFWKMDEENERPFSNFKARDQSQ